MIKPNPPWEIDELILALDLYLRKGQLGEDAPEVVELSQVLNQLSIHEERGEYGTFRNPAGVAMKLGNFARLDPTYEGSGLARGSKKDKEVWARFASNRGELSQLAGLIRSGARLDTLPQQVEDGEHQVREGRYAFRIHRRAERNSKLASRKKKAVKQKTGRLACEVCDLDFEEFYGDLGKGFIECHHLVPLSRGQERVTSAADLALLCSNCHSMIHRTDPLELPEDLRARVGETGRSDD